MHSMEIASTHRRNSGRKEGPMASSEAIGGEYPAFLARARAAGLDGKW
jgi:hypothetical protein